MSTKRKPRIHFTMDIQFHDGDQWITSSLTYTSTDQAASAAYTALKNYADTGFFPTVRLRQWEAPPAKRASPEPILPSGFEDPREH